MSFIDDFEELRRNGSFNYDPTKSHAYTRGIFKTAALFFDKVYIDKFDYMTLCYMENSDIPPDAVFLNDKITGGIAHYMDKGERGEVINEQDAFIRGVLDLARKQNFAFIPLYGTIHKAGEKIAQQTNSLSGKPNQLDTIELLLTSFPSISEHNLTWEQVGEFRNDIASIGGLRKIRALLIEVAKCNSTVEVSDTVGLAIENYREACSKHGVELFSSIFNQIYDKNTLIASIGAGIITGSPETGILAGGVKLLADISMTVYSSKRNKAEILEKHQMGEAALHLRKLENTTKTRLGEHVPT